MLPAFKVSDMLDRLYCAYDALAEQHQVYKIDTIGDGELQSYLDENVLHFCTSSQA